MAEGKNPTRQTDSAMQPVNTNHPEAAKRPETTKRPEAEKKPNPAYAGLAAKLKSYRMAKEMSQKDFAAFLGIPFRTYCNYEAGHRYPRNMEIVNKMATALGVTTENLLGASGGYIVETNEKGDSRDRKKMEQMVTQLSAMFAGGDIDQESKDLAMAALNGVYWKHKKENRKRYTTNQNRDKNSEAAEEGTDGDGTMQADDGISSTEITENVDGAEE